MKWFKKRKEKKAEQAAQEALESAAVEQHTEEAVVENTEPAVESAPEQKAVADVAPPAEVEAPSIEEVQPVAEQAEPAEVPAQTDEASVPEPEQEQKAGFFRRLKDGLKRTGSTFSEGVGELVLGKKEIDDELLEDLEALLVSADVGIETSQAIIENLTKRVKRKELANAEALTDALQAELQATLTDCSQPLQVDISKKPFVILMVGVNGAGKTTTIGKLARRFQSEGKSVMLAAGDTFRAAAVEQLQVWGERNDVPVIAQHTGADSASVIFDALQAAKARGTDVLIADTAGRLHNNDNLMEELKKVVRVMGKIDPEAPHEVMLVLDAGTGQNALSQAKHFRESVGVTGITLTKLDGTAKGGIIFAVGQQLQLPIRFIGVGEQAEDLRPFEAGEFVRALFDKSDNDA
jgi:fused signal recognition particle receptor